jgi:hypothetical protein
MLARDEAGVFFAKHYTSDYAVVGDLTSVRRVGDFRTVRHTIALEGAVTIVAPDEPGERLPESLSQFKTVTFRQHYVPIALLALHEQNFLIERTTSSIVSAAEMDDPVKTRARLLAVREATLVFRLCFQFSEISYISMHNAFYRALREVFRADRLVADLATTRSEIAGYLGTVIDEERHRKYYWATVLGGASLAGLTGYTIVHETAELIWKDDQLTGLVSIAVGALVFAVAAFIGYRQRPTHDHGHLTMHAMLKAMIGKAMGH